MQLTNELLNELLIEVTNHSEYYHIYTSSYFHDLYLTGCRPVELLDITKWKIVGESLELTTAKTEAKRIISPVWLSMNFKRSVSYREAPYNGLTYDQAVKEFRRVLRMHPITTENKVADLYLFRYNRAKQLFGSTKDITTVMHFFGWLSPAMAHNYIYKPLEYNPDFRLW